MRVISKLICSVRGHYPLSHVDVEPPPPPKPLTSIELINGGTGYTISALQTHGVAGTSDPYFYPTRVKTDATLTISSGPLQSKLHICARCHGVYWDTRPFLPSLADANMVPALKDHITWNHRMHYERKQREGNETARKLYQQYKVALKLGEHDPDPNIDSDKPAS